MTGFIEAITDRYRGGRDRLFILHGNTNDLFPFSSDGTEELLSLPDFLYRSLSGGAGTERIWLHYSLGYDLRSIGDEKTHGFKRLGQLVKDGVDKIENAGAPINFFRLLDGVCVRRERFGESEGTLVPLRVIVTDAHLVIPEAQTVFMRSDDRELLVLLKRFASEPRYDVTDMLLVLVTDALSGIHRELRECAVTIEIPRPNEQAIGAHLERATSGKQVVEPAELTPMKSLAVGLTVRQVQNVVAEHIATQTKLTPAILAARRRELTGRDYGEFLEFFDPAWTLDDVGGSREAVSELKELAEAFKRGDRDVPSGVILVGQNGIGKTFIVKAFLGSAGIPGVILKSFQDSPLGSSERNWEKIETAVRSAGQIAVFVDEADAQMGQRSGPNVHEVSRKIFSAQMQLMGNPQYRGKILWILTTCRPDKLAPDVKRPGRCERVIPLFPLVSNEDVAHILGVQLNLLTRKDGYEFSPDVLSSDSANTAEYLKSFVGKTGAQVERVLRRARRLAKGNTITRQHVEQVIASGKELDAEPMAYELQRLLGILEAVETENEDLIPEFYRKQIAEFKGVEGLRRRVQILRGLVDET